MYGRSGWYSHDYTDRELEETAGMLCDLAPGRVYIFFNNHAMLKNARVMKSILGSL